METWKSIPSVLFCGSGTINIDACISSLLPEGGKVLVVNNGAYSTRAVEVCQYYGLPHIDLSFPVDELPDLEKVEQTLKENPDIALVHTTHNETGTGILNPIREIGALAHKYHATFTVDTTSTYAMRPIILKRTISTSVWPPHRKADGHDGTILCRRKPGNLEASKDYPKRSYYCNLYQQYDFLPENRRNAFYPAGTDNLRYDPGIEGILGRGRGSQVGETHQSLRSYP